MPVAGLHIAVLPGDRVAVGQGGDHGTAEVARRLARAQEEV
jgi:hypothetical protein